MAALPGSLTAEPEPDFHSARDTTARNLRYKRKPPWSFRVGGF